MADSFLLVDAGRVRHPRVQPRPFPYSLRNHLPPASPVVSFWCYSMPTTFVPIFADHEAGVPYVSYRHTLHLLSFYPAVHHHHCRYHPRRPFRCHPDSALMLDRRRRRHCQHRARWRRYLCQPQHHCHHRHHLYPNHCHYRDYYVYSWPKDHWDCAI